MPNRYFADSECDALLVRGIGFWRCAPISDCGERKAEPRIWESDLLMMLLNRPELQAS
jgi:hypothetical protein